MMANLINYNSPYASRSFDSVHRATMWAGFLGIGQAIGWLALTATGISSYKCLINPPSSVTFGSLIDSTFLNLYFSGSCYKANYDDSTLKAITTVLDPTQIFIWECVYLAVAFIWLCSSVLVITHVRRDNKPGTAGIILFWVCVTACISFMDLALGVIFGIDFGKFHRAGLDQVLSTTGTTTIDNGQYVNLLAGSVTAFSLMIISLKGFLLWIVNVALSIHLAIHAFLLLNDNDGNDTLFISRMDSSDILSTGAPIHAYEEQKISTAFNNEAYIPDNRSMNALELNEASLARAARMSMDVALQERRFRNVDSFHQYPPPRAHVSSKPESMGVQSPVSTFPAPDYSPPMSRAYQGQSQNGLLRNQRY